MTVRAGGNHMIGEGGTECADCLVFLTVNQERLLFRTTHNSTWAGYVSEDRFADGTELIVQVPSNAPAGTKFEVGVANYNPVLATFQWNSASSVTTVTVLTSNLAPSFPATETGIRSVAENTDPGTEIGAPVAAEDPDSGDVLTYTLGGTDAASFRIDSATGQLSTEAALNFEQRASTTSP